MAKIKLSKNELKRQKDALKRYLRYLPTLVLKKQQLQMEIRKLERLLDKKIKEYERQQREIMQWVHVFGKQVGFEDFVIIKKVKLNENNVAGIDVPVFDSIEFSHIEYDLFTTPLWIDKAIIACKENIMLGFEIYILELQQTLIAEELRITTQRINLFEKVKIPEAQENIRIIQIYLGDQQIAAVVRGKISKKKIIKSIGGRS